MGLKVRVQCRGRNLKNIDTGKQTLTSSIDGPQQQVCHEATCPEGGAVWLLIGSRHNGQLRHHKFTVEAGRCKFTYVTGGLLTGYLMLDDMIMAAAGQLRRLQALLRLYN
jgi:hypothetical protein